MSVLTGIRRCSFAILVVSAILGLTPGFAADNAPAVSTDPFGLTKVWKVHVEIPAKEFDAMQPALPAFPGPGGPPPAAPATPKRESERNLFGTEFPWVEGAFTADNQTHKAAAIRYSGDITYFVSGQALKRPLKVRLDKTASAPNSPSFGATSLQLHSMPLDASKLREVLACSLFRAAGVPSPRTAFAEVTLTVPGKHDKAYLGLYTVVEGVDAQFLATHFGTDQGLLMKPFGIRGIDYLGDDWAAYKERYRPQREATKQEAQRVIEFAKLVNQSTPDEFSAKLDTFLDVNPFLRFMAANAMTANLESFFALGHNYHLYLDPKTNKFQFIPGDLEFSYANFLLMGSAEQVLDLSLVKPYPGENKLPDRLLSIPGVRRAYVELVKELREKHFRQSQLLDQIEALETATKEIREKEAAAATARREPPAGFGGPGPQAPTLKTFVARRLPSIHSQLEGKTKGFEPQPLNFGPPAGGGRGGQEIRAITAETFKQDVEVPPEFDAVLFGAPPKVSYPVAISAAPTGEVYIAVDEQGSLGRTPNGGKILRCLDTDDDGQADEITVFARVDHPRGVCYRDGSVWVMHPPTLSVFRDTDGDGISNTHEVLVTGLTTEQITNRGGDHTTNCVRMGIDGWLYIGVGDYGIKQAEGKDGRKISLRGGGVVRLRPDGKELEIYCTGLRNPFDLAIDPFLNVFTRDNTNDGGGWDIRVSHLMQSAEYGYTRLFANFTDEIMPTMGTFGGGGGTGGLFVQDPSWPEQFRDNLYAGDWGRSEVYRYELKPHGATFDLQQEVFLKVPRATGMDIDASGRLYVASWRSGEAAVNVGPNVGFVARVTPKGFKPTPFPNLGQTDNAGLLKLLASPQAVTRLHAQGEILSRGPTPAAIDGLIALMSDSSALLEGRVAAIFTLKQLSGSSSHTALLKATEDSSIREFALRALTDRQTELDGLDPQPFIAALSDESARVRAQALISLGRLKDRSAGKSIIPLTSRPAGSTMPTQQPRQNQPDADRVVSHLATRTLVSLGAVDACLEALDGPHWSGALRTLRSMHEPAAVDGLIKKLAIARDADLRRGILATLIRLYHREADYDGSWWGIRPDSTGPFYDPVEWDLSARIGAVVTAAVLDSDASTSADLRKELSRHRVALPGLPDKHAATAQEQEIALVLPKADPNVPNQIGNLAFEAVLNQTLAAQGEAQRGEALFKRQSCVACHTTADGQTPKGPHLVDIGKRYKPAELVESILRPSVKLAQGFEAYNFELADGRVLTGFVVSERAQSTMIREPNGVQRELKRTEIEARVPQKVSAMPEGIVANLTPTELADLVAYLQSLK